MNDKRSDKIQILLYYVRHILIIFINTMVRNSIMYGHKRGIKCLREFINYFIFISKY